MAGLLERWRIVRRVCLLKGYLTFVVICINMPHSYSQEGFLSIDCGNSQTNYTDSNKLEWVADDGTYIKTGKSSEQLFLNSSLDRPLRSFRYFPEPRSKYCYELPTPDYSYLIRPSFYMNESVLNDTGSFEFIVSVDANDWFIVKSGDKSDKSLFIVQEALFYFWLHNSTSVCLRPVKGVPFISSLEMRVIDDSYIYDYGGSYYQYFALSVRYNTGANSTAPDVRYPDDRFDRIWKAPQNAHAFPIISSPEPLDNTSYDDYQTNYVPPKVMQDGWKFRPDASDHATFPVYADGSQVSLMSPGDFAFASVYSEYLNASTSDSYNLLVYFDYDTNLERDLLINFSRESVASDYAYFFPLSNALNVSFNLTDDKGKYVIIPEGPTLNAIEIFSLINYNFSLTNDDDALVIKEMKNGFLLNDWQGDPCVSVPYDWLSCYSTELSATYVTSVNLSKLTSNQFRNAVNGSSNSKFHSLNEMSITESEVDSPTFELLISYTSTMLSTLNFSYNAITSLPTTWENTSESLVVVDLSHNQLEGSMYSLNKWVERNYQSLQQLNVSNNNLSGTFNSSLYFSGLPNIVLLDFDQNSIEGTLDLSAWYQAMQEASTNTSANISKTITLQLFSFVNNNILDITPSAETLASAIQNLLKETKTFSTKGILLGGNPYCKNAKSYIQQYLCRSSTDEEIKDVGDNKKKILIISISSVLAALLLCCTFFATLWKLWKQVYTLRAIQQALADQKVQPPFFQYNDLKLATRDFHSNNKLGAGGFGVVYKGVLADQTPLAVKKLYNSQSVQGLDEFLNEVVLITGIKHRNLVQLKGCCIKDRQRMLVYELAENGNVAEALWGKKDHPDLNWELSLNICLGVARGLSYLHEELQPSIIHRDIKPENILLDKDFKPKIADFGLARHFFGETTQAQYTQISRIAGTKGYFAPEYVMHGQLSEKADVYSYGILVLEVICGRKCIDLSLPMEEKILIDWVGSMRKKNSLLAVLRPELRDNCVEAEVLRAINIGLLCTHHDPGRRPSMSQVVIMFLGSMDIGGFFDKLGDIPLNWRRFSTTSYDDMEFPTLQVVEEDSNIFPLVDMDVSSQSFLGNSSLESHSHPVIELSSFRPDSRT